MTKNTAYRIKTDIITDAERLTYKKEEGAIVQTETGYWCVRDDAWVDMQSSDFMRCGWVRWDDSQYTSASKLTIAQDATVTVPNNGNSIINHIHTPTDLYNPATGRVFGLKENDTYTFTVVFKASAANANTTYGSLKLQGGNGTPYERIASTVVFPKGNDVDHDFHYVHQYYVDTDFVTNGNYWTITAEGGAIKIWGIIFFVQRNQSR